ncbi:MAG: DUF1097 domain-containing protein [Chloroflexi bacterium]|nr:DUF1097 domain-containing protein [Chloroflexota bacterium]
MTSSDSFVGPPGRLGARPGQALRLKLTPQTAGALAAAIVAGVTVWAFAQLPGLWVWAAFLGWASYDQAGADRRALISSSACAVFGVVMAWLVAVAVQLNLVPGPNSIASAVDAGVASFVIVYASRWFPLSNVPASFCGFASTFAVLLLVPATFTINVLTSASVSNVLVCVPVSLLIGSVLGVIHQRVVLLLTDRRRRAMASAAPVRLTPLDSTPAALRPNA